MSKIIKFENCLTVKELKEIISEWPETNEDGSCTEVYLGDANRINSPAIEISTLNDKLDLLILHAW